MAWMAALSAGYLSAAHYLVLTFASGLEAKRAALASGFCPPQLAGGFLLLGAAGMLPAMA